MKTPIQKAEELINKFLRVEICDKYGCRNHIKDGCGQFFCLHGEDDAISIAKQCALIAAKELYELAQELDYEIGKDKEFYKQVIIEIEKSLFNNKPKNSMTIAIERYNEWYEKVNK